MPYRETTEGQVNEVASDAELATKLQNTGDAGAFSLLIKRHGALLGSFLSRLAGEKAQSLLPMVFERLRDRSYAIRDVSCFHLWALGVVASIWREETKDDPTPEEGSAAFQAIHKIAHHLRPVFVLVHYFQMSLEDVAIALRIPRGTATSRLQDAFASLAAQLAPVLPPPIPAVESISENVVVEALLSEEAPSQLEIPATTDGASAKAPEEPKKEAAPAPEPPKEPEAAKAPEPPKESPKEEPPKAPEPVVTGLSSLIPKLSLSQEEKS